MEGRHSGVDPDRVIDAAGTLRRIMYRLSGIAIGRLSMPQVAVPAEIEAAREAYETSLRYHLQLWLDVVEQEPGPDRRRIIEVAKHFTPDDLTVPLKKLNEHLSAPEFGELVSWPAAARSVLLAEIESYRRVIVLVIELNQQFAEIPVPTR